MKVTPSTFVVVLYIVGISRMNARNVTSVAVPGDYTHLHLMHFSERKHGPFRINLASEFAAETCNNRSDILPGYKLHIEESLTKCEVCMHCVNVC